MTDEEITTVDLVADLITHLTGELDSVGTPWQLTWDGPHPTLTYQVKPDLPNTIIIKVSMADA